MRLIDDHDRFDVLNALQELNLAVQSSFGVAAIETTFCAELSKDAVVEVSRCQLRICKIEGPLSAALQLVRQFANQRGFPASAIAGKDTKPASLRRIGETRQYFFLLGCGKEAIHRKVACEGCGGKVIVCFKHGRYPP